MNHVPVLAFKKASKMVSFTQISARVSAGFDEKTVSSADFPSPPLTQKYYDSMACASSL